MNDIANIIATLAVAGTFFGLAKGLWEFRRKTDLEMFRAYTEKYNKIIIPEIHDKWNKACKSHDPEDWKGLDHVAIAFLNLVWEEIYLHKTGVIRRNIWQIWLPEIKTVLQTKFAAKMMHRHEFEFLEAELKNGLD